MINNFTNYIELFLEDFWFDTLGLVEDLADGYMAAIEHQDALDRASLYAHQPGWPNNTFFTLSSRQ